MPNARDLERMAEAVRSGELSRREFLRRAAHLAGGVVAASSLLQAAGCAAPTEPAKPGAAPAAGPAKPATQATGPVNWMTWSTYNNPEIKGAFEKDTGIAINPITFNDNAEVLIKLKQTGGKGLDVVQGDAFWPIKYYQEGLIEPLDLNEFSSAKTLLPAFRNYKMWQTPDGKMMQYPLFWAVAGLCYVKGKVPSPPDSWNALLDSQYKGRMLWYTQDFMFAAMGMLLGAKDPFNLPPEQLEQAKQMLIKAKPNVKVIPRSSSDLVKAFVSGEVDVGLMSSRGQILRIKAAGGPEVGFVVPKEGVMGWIDGNMIVKGAEHREAAKLWIDFYHRPEHMFKLAKAVKYSVADARALEMLEKDPEGPEIIAANDMKNTALLDKMHLRKPPDNLDAYLKTWNEILAS